MNRRYILLMIPDEAEYKAFRTDELFVAQVGTWQAAAKPHRDRPVAERPTG
jgi:hypothetical protein